MMTIAQILNDTIRNIEAYFPRPEQCPKELRYHLDGLVALMEMVAQQFEAKSSAIQSPRVYESMWQNVNRWDDYRNSGYHPPSSSWQDDTDPSDDH